MARDHTNDPLYLKYVGWLLVDKIVIRRDVMILRYFTVITHATKHIEVQYWTGCFCRKVANYLVILTTVNG